MSGVDSENLTLYANRYLYNGSRYVFYQGNNRADGLSYEQWLAQTSDEISEQMTVYYKSLTEDLELNSPVGDMIKYTYGKLTNDGHTYYIFIDRIVTDQHGKSYISFSVDWWATSWNNVHPTIGHLTRKPTKPGYMAQPWTPMTTTSEEEVITKNYCIMATYIPSSDKGTSYISYIVLPGDELNTRMVEQGYWYNILGIPGADIKDCFVVPLFTYDDFSISTGTTIHLVNGEHSGVQGDGFSGDWIKRYLVTEYVDKPGIGDIFFNMHDSKFYRCNDSLYDHSTEPPRLYTYYGEIENPNLNQDIIEYIAYRDKTSGEYYKFKQNQMTDVYLDYTKQISINIQTTEKRAQGIMDWNGNIIWECPYGIDITGFTVRLLKGISHVMLQFTPNNLSDLLTGRGFIYDCRHPGLFVDSYQDYVLKNREYDIAMRSIQSERQVWSAAASTLENIGFGYAFGDSATAHKGNSKGRPPYGAIAAGVGGVLETISTFITNQYFDPKIQEQYDLRYARMTDQISLIGDSITNVFIEDLLIKYTLIMDVATQDRMDTDILVNGYICDEITTSVESIFAPGAILQADNVTIEGACCLDAKQQTVYRLQNGVEFK